GDGTGDDCFAGNGLRLQETLIDDIRATGPGRDVLGGDEDRHLAFAVLDVTLVVDDVDARQDGGKRRQSDGDPDVLGAVIHSPFFFGGGPGGLADELNRFDSKGGGGTRPALGEDPLGDVLGEPTDQDRVVPRHGVRREVETDPTDDVVLRVLP